MGVDTKWLAKQQETRMSDTTVTITSETFEYMADRIEELDALDRQILQLQIEWVKQLADDLIAAEGREARLKEKLAKALTALGDVQWFVKDLEPYADQGHTLVPALQKACAVYVELTSSVAADNEVKGGKDE